MENFGSWSILTTNFLIILYLALGGVTLASVLQLVNAKWRFPIRRLAVSFAILFPVAGILLIILLVNGEHTFQWLPHAHEAGNHLPGWHNYLFLFCREILGFVTVGLLYVLFIKYQHESEIDDSYRAQRRFRNIALLIPFIYFSYASMVAWDFEMTMSPGWHSSIYAPYHFQSNFVCFLAVMYLVVLYFGKSGRLTKPIEPKLYNYFAQFMLAMTILWTYLYFAQYLIMWYGRLPHEMDRYHNMMTGFAPLWWTFLSMKFIFPFVTLAFTPNRHNPAVIALVACSIIIGTWIERYTWIAGSVKPSEYHMPMTAASDWIITIGLFVISLALLRWTWSKFDIVKARA
ncbi:MAG: hypothetical protein D6698_03125 [Gammaproteobacteria bacterium]|nr:MAG: hypothetical protein D6698_03125 [Gammaproteobacteria bacterium]